MPTDHELLKTILAARRMLDSQPAPQRDRMWWNPETGVFEDVPDADL